MTDRQRWALIVLGILVALVWIRGLTVRPVRSHRAAPLKSKVFEPAPVNSEPTPVSRSPAIPSRSEEWGDNPFLMERRLPTEPVNIGAKGQTLAGILWDPKNPSAIVDNRLVKVGDRIGAWQVVEIRKEEVILSDGMATQSLTVE